MTDITILWLALDLLLTGFTAGTTVWFFFIQSPYLFKVMGREKFVPIMMGMTKLFFQTMFASVTGIVAVSLLIQQQQDNKASSINLFIVLSAWLAVLLNRFVIVPMALKAGVQSQKERKGDNSRDAVDFAVRGGSKTETKMLHQTVVAFVLIMTGALVAHLVNVIAVMQ
jgi:hypothetical protein